MGKICPQCGYHQPENTPMPQIYDYSCQHEYEYMVVNNPTQPTTSNVQQIKWRCKKCLDVKYTTD